MPSITCDTCGSTKEAKAGKSDVKLPRGWKRHQDKTWCEQCFGAGRLFEISNSLRRDRWADPLGLGGPRTLNINQVDRSRPAGG